MEHRFIIYAFVGGKCVANYDVHDLDILVVVRAKYRNCELSIYDFEKMRPLCASEIEDALRRSHEKWRAVIYGGLPDNGSRKPDIPKQKAWKIQVMCIESGETYGSIRDCANAMHIPYMTILNCIRRGNATQGVHFLLVEHVNEKDNESEHE